LVIGLLVATGKSKLEVEGGGAKRPPPPLVVVPGGGAKKDEDPAFVDGGTSRFFLATPILTFIFSPSLIVKSLYR